MFPVLWDSGSGAATEFERRSHKTQALRGRGLAPVQQALVSLDATVAGGRGRGGGIPPTPGLQKMDVGRERGVYPAMAK